MRAKFFNFCSKFGGFFLNSFLMLLRVSCLVLFPVSLSTTGAPRRFNFFDKNRKMHDMKLSINIKNSKNKIELNSVSVLNRYRTIVGLAVKANNEL